MHMRIRRSTKALAVALLGLAASCKPVQSDSLVKDSTTLDSAPAELNYVVLFAQGFYSCTYGYHDAPDHFDAVFNAALEASKQKHGLDGAKVNVAYLESCFTGGMVQNGGREKLYYTVREVGEAKSAQHEAMPQAIGVMANGIANRMGKPGNPARVIMVGHSHGGWITMTGAQLWQPGPDLRVLATLDPISYKKCSQSGMIFEKVRQLSIPFASLMMSNECERAPSDLSAAGPAIAKNISKGWFNFYQTSFSPLHSGPIADAKSNQLLNYSGVRFAHANVLYDQRAWDVIDQQITADVEEGFAAAGEPSH